MEINVSPVAQAKYPFVCVPDTKFNPEGVYRIELRLDLKNKSHKEFLSELKSKFVETKGKNAPYKAEINEEKEKTGFWLVRFKSKYPVKIFDSKGKKIEREQNFIGNDSTVRVSYVEGTYTQNEGGLSLYLQAVQILELTEWDGGKAENYGFSEEEKGYVVEDEEKNISKGVIDDSVSASESETEEDIPF